MEEVRGKAHNLGRYKQLVDYSKLRWGQITPTDVDGALDFGGRLYVFIELKYRDAPLPHGQQLCLERICDRLRDDTTESLLIIASHNTPPEREIDASECVVREYRLGGVWHTPPCPHTMRQIIDSALKLYVPELSWPGRPYPTHETEAIT